MLIAMIPFVFHGDRDTTVHPNNGNRILRQSVGHAKEVKRGQVPGGRTYTRTILTEASGRKIPRALESKALATRGREQPCGLLYRSARPERDAGDVAFLPRTIVSRLTRAECPTFVGKKSDIPIPT